MKARQLAVILLLFSCVSLAQTHIWTGNGGDTDWFNAANWDVNSVPDASSDVLIDGAAIVDISGNTASVNSLSLAGTATLQQQSGFQLMNTFVIGSSATFTILSGDFSGGSVTNNGTITIETFSDKGFVSTHLTNNALIQIIDSDTVDLLDGTIIDNNENGEIRIESPGGLIQNVAGATINNYGYIVKINEGMGGAFYMIFDMNNHGVIEAQQDQDFLFLTLGADFHNYSDGLLTGSGAFDITANFFNEGTITPAGDEVGTMEVVNNFNMIGNSVLEVDIHGSVAGEYDVLDVFGDPELEGSIIVHPQLSADDIGSQFTVMTTNFEISSCNILNYAEGTDGVDTFLFDVYCNSNDITLELYGILLGSEDFQKEKAWGFFPNPSQDEITFQLENLFALEESIQVKVINQLGQIVQSEEVAPQRSWNMDISNLSNGVYFIEMESAGLQFRTQKLVKI